MDKNFYITTPIYYPSARPHMGHAYSSIIADFFARFKRIDGFNVHFLTGTDEHGLKIQRAAEKREMQPLNFCDEISQTFKDLSKTLNLSNTDFIRTTEERHKKAVQYLWTTLEKNGDIYLSKYYENNPEFISPKSKKNEVISFVKSGLKDLSISRKAFSWGIKVPNNEEHVIYVWLDALTNYISALNYPDTSNDLFKKFWPASIHLIGKDILRFHAIYWPAFLMAAKIPLPKKVYGHGWILSGDEKMSKSKGNILDPIDIIDIYGLDPLRYYLIKEVSFGNDGNISREKLEDCINSDLANNFGNLCQRVTAFAEKNCSLKVPVLDTFNDEDLVMLDKFKNNLSLLRKEIDNQNINFYINFIVSALFEANKYFNDQEPWKKKNDQKRLNSIIYTSLEMIRKISFMLYPIIPDSILKVITIFNLNIGDIKFESIANNNFLETGKSINKIDILFKKIEKND